MGIHLALNAVTALVVGFWSARNNYAFNFKVYIGRLKNKKKKIFSFAKQRRFFV